MKVLIEDTQNGYIIKYQETLDDDTDVIKKIVVEKKEEFSQNKCDQHWDIKALAEVCYVIADLFSVYGNKHADPPCRFTVDCECAIEEEYENRKDLESKE